MTKNNNGEDSTDNTEKSDSTRRRALRKIGFGSAIVTLASQWQKPNIDSVMLPAHAQASEMDS